MNFEEASKIMGMGDTTEKEIHLGIALAIIHDSEINEFDKLQIIEIIEKHMKEKELGL